MVSLPRPFSSPAANITTVKKIMKRIALLIIALFWANMILAQMADTVPETYCYAMRGEREMKMDIYRPLRPRADNACVLHIFGGGFYGGARDNKECKRTAKALTKRGFMVVSIDYRLKLKEMEHDTNKREGIFDLFDCAIRWAAEDCADAIGYLCSHAKELGIDTSRIILTGSSAGAITALQTDYLRCNRDSIVRNIPEGFRPAAIVAYSGAIYTRQGAVKYRYDKPAPTCFFHGTSDRIVNYKHRQLGRTHWAGPKHLDKIFDQEGYPHWTMRFDKLGHEVAILLPHTTAELEAFVDCALSGRNFNYDAHCSDEGLKPSKFSKTTLIKFYSGRVKWE